MTNIRTDINQNTLVAGPDEFQAARIGPIQVWPPVILAPMAGVTNPPFRSLCREFGAGLYVSEMISARGLTENNSKTWKLAQFSEKETLRSIQLYGTEPVSLGASARRLVQDGHVDHIDLNFGCPVKKVTRQGGGSAIPLKPKLLRRLVRSVVKAADPVPVTIKVRLGIDDQYLSFMDSGRIARDEGCAAIGLHARTAAQLYAGDANWNCITELKNALEDFTVLGNGDIWEGWDALRMMRQTGCDGVIVGRGCLGRPWLFRDLVDVFEGREPQEPPALGEIVRIMEDHAHRLVAFFGEKTGILHMRKWSQWYLKGFPGTQQVRRELSQTSSIEEMLIPLKKLDPQTPFPLHSIRANRAKRGGTQRPTLPAGYLENLDDDTPPSPSPNVDFDTVSGG